jgi:hypothetical protein
MLSRKVMGGIFLITSNLYDFSYKHKMLCGHSMLATDFFTVQKTSKHMRIPLRIYAQDYKSFPLYLFSCISMWVAGNQTPKASMNCG